MRRIKSSALCLALVTFSACKTEAEAQSISAIADLLWPVFAAVVLFVLWPAVKTAIESRKFKIKVGDFEISFEDFLEQSERKIDDLSEQVSQLRQLAGVEPAVTKGTPVRNRVLWVDPEPEKRALDIASLKGKTEVVSVPSASAAKHMLEEGGFFDKIVGVGSSTSHQLSDLNVRGSTDSQLYKYLPNEAHNPSSDTTGSSIVLSEWLTRPPKDR